MMNFFYFNKLSELHNGVDIIFCKTDYVYDEFNYIKSLTNDLILITGNSDYPITDKEVELSPNNIKIWFAQNAISNNDKIVPIPLGIENKTPSLRLSHGIGYYDRVKNKEFLLSRNINKEPTKLIYANFDVNTNKHIRTAYKDISINSSFIDWEEPNLSINEFFDRILDYKMVLCPIGNGIDTHRLWEVLYSGRIPITVKVGNYKIYELYNKLPIIVLNDISELNDRNLIEEKYNITIKKQSNSIMLESYYWINLIKNYGSTK